MAGYVYACKPLLLLCGFATPSPMEASNFCDFLELTSCDFSHLSHRWQKQNIFGGFKCERFKDKFTNLCPELNNFHCNQSNQGEFDPHYTCQIYITLHSKHAKITLECQIFVWIALVYAQHFSPHSVTKLNTAKERWVQPSVMSISNNPLTSFLKMTLISIFIKEINGLFGIDITDVNINSGNGCVHRFLRWSV